MRLINADKIPWDVDGVGTIPVVTKEEVNKLPTIDAIPVSYFAEELHLIREILARRKDLSMEYRRELEAEKKYLRDWINHWRYESDQGFYGVQWKALSEDEIIAKREEVDAEHVVRCKDCKYVGTDATCFLVCDRDGMGLRPFHVYHDDYCSYGERKEE